MVNMDKKIEDKVILELMFLDGVGREFRWGDCWIWMLLEEIVGFCCKSG